MSEVSERAREQSERSEHSKAERCGASEWSERCEHSKKKRRYLIVVFQKIVFLRTFLYFVSKHQIQRIVQQIQRIVQQIPENCEKYKKCTRSPGKKRKIQKMY